MRRKVLARDNWEVRFVTCPIARMPYNLRIERLVRTPFQYNKSKNFWLKLYFRISLHLKKMAHVPEILSRGIYSSSPQEASKHWEVRFVTCPIARMPYTNNISIGSVRDKKCCHVLEIFVSQTSHQNPVGINTIALVSSWENV